MKAKRSRFRRILKRTGVVLCVVMLGLWAASAFWVVGWAEDGPKQRTIILGDGCILLIQYCQYCAPSETWCDITLWLRAYETPGWHWEDNDYWASIGGCDDGEDRRDACLDVVVVANFAGLGPPRMTRFRHPHAGGIVGKGARIDIPLWLPFLIMAIPTAFMFWRDRKRIPAGHCSTCGYNLTGAEHERCPECGEACEETWAGA